MTGPQEPDSPRQGLVWLASRTDFTHQTLSLFCCPPFPAPDSLLWPDGEVHDHRSATLGAGTEAVCSGDVRPCVYKAHCSTGPARCRTVNTQPPLQGGSDGHGTPRAQGPPACPVSLCQGQARSQVPPDTTHNALSQLPPHLRVCRSPGWEKVSDGEPGVNPT